MASGTLGVKGVSDSLGLHQSSSVFAMKSTDLQKGGLTPHLSQNMLMNFDHSAWKPVDLDLDI